MDNKARKALEREEKEVQKKIAAEKRLEKRRQAEIEKLQKAIEHTEKAIARAAHKAQLEENKAVRANKLAPKSPNKASRALPAKHKLIMDLVELPVAKQAVATNQRGWPVITPACFV